MAQDVLVTLHLTEELIEGGEALTQKIDELGIPITAAFWFLEEEKNEWKLFFASPEVGSHGPLKVYRVIQTAIKQLGGASFSVPFMSISLLGEQAELVKSFRTVFSTGPGIHRIRLGRDVVNGHHVEDALIYRVL